MADYAVELCKLGNSLTTSSIVPDSDCIIYHYTSPGGFKGIIENRTIRFTDRYFLNDYSEGTYVMELCVKYITSILPNNEPFRDELIKQCTNRREHPQRDDFYVHQCSFSKDEDNLALWNYYTKGDNIQGYNLSFDAHELCDGMILTSVLPSGNVPVIWKGDVVYTESEQLVIIKNIIEKYYHFSEMYNHRYLDFTIGYLVDKLMIAGIFFKKECFKVENEYRIVLDLHIDKQTGKFTAISEEQKFYEKNGILIPFLDIKFEPKCLKSIKISPTLDIKSTENSIYRATLKDFPHINKNNAITQSEIPIRY